MDNLAKDAFLARQNGMSYGKYMATKKPAERKVPAKKKEPKIGSCETTCYCARCGKAFEKKTKSRQKYCSEECMKKTRSERELERYRKKKAKNAGNE
jgi:hypothetical protein